MRKIIVILIFILVFVTIFNVFNDEIIIPSSSIRFRVIANSDSEIDQNIKILVKNNVENVLFNKLDGVSSIDSARKIIKDNVTLFDSVVNDTLLDNNIKMDFSVNFGYNYFPEKEYKGIVYEAGEYESLVVTLGEGKGSNWWCVMFPPLCMIEAQDNYDSNETEYRFFIKDLIDKYF